MSSWTVRFVLFAIVFGAILVPRLALRPAILWSIGLGVAMAIASGSFRQWAIARHNRQLIEQAAGLVEPRDGQVTAVCGTIEAEGATLTSPIYDERVVAYQYTMYHDEYRYSTTQRRSVSHRFVDYAGFGAVPASVKGQYFEARLGQFPILHDFGEGQTELGETLRQVREQPPVGVSLRDVPGVAAAIGDSADKREQSRLENADRHLRSTTFDPVPKGEMIEYVKIMDKNWDGTGRVTKNFRRDTPEPYDPKQCDFWEQRVTPGAQVCALGTWSQSERALIGTPRQDLWLYPGTPEDVSKLVGSAVGAAWFFALLLTVASVATTAYLVVRKSAGVLNPP